MGGIRKKSVQYVFCSDVGCRQGRGDVCSGFHSCRTCRDVLCPGWRGGKKLGHYVVGGDIGCYQGRGAVRSLSLLFRRCGGVLFNGTCRKSSIVQVQSRVLVKRSKLRGEKIINSDKIK